MKRVDWIEVDRKHDIKRVEAILNKSIQKKPKRLKVGILGYGYMGKIRHKTLEDFEEFQVVGIFDPNESAMNNLDKSVVAESSKELIEKTDIDVIFLCVPNYLVKDYVIKVLKAGKHVFCEKPPGINTNEVREMGEMSRKHPDLKLKFGFNHRYNSSIMKLVEITESGHLGNILWIRGAYGKGSDGRIGNDSWRSNKKYSGGGILMDQGIHMLDICLMLCGPFEEVKGIIGTQCLDSDVEDNALLIMRNKRGQMVQVHSSSTQWKHLFRLEVFFEKGYVIVNGMVTRSGSYGPENIMIAQNHEIERANALGKPREETIFFDRNFSWKREIKEFSDDLLKDIPVQVGTTENAVMDAIHNLSNRMTIIMIAHRLSTIKECDVIYFLDKGKIADSGSYNELIKSNQKFKEMSNML
jgi:predicted dehydrogenase